MLSIDDPWKQPECHDGLEGLKILILGESAPKNIERDGLISPSISTQRVLDFLISVANGGNRESYQLFGTIDRVLELAFQKPTASQSFLHVTDRWSRVAFANTVPGTVDRKGPTAEEWERVPNRFQSLVTDLKPDLILCFSIAADRRLPGTLGPQGSDYVLFDQPESSAAPHGGRPFSYRLDDGSAALYGNLYHPRGMMPRLNKPGMALEDWAGWVKQLAELARREKLRR